MNSVSHQGSPDTQSLGDFDHMFKFQCFVSTVAEEGPSVAVQHIFMLIELFNWVASSAERQVRNTFFLVFVAMLARRLFLKCNTIEIFTQGRVLLWLPLT